MAKAIRGAVGAGGANGPADVFTVQYLLNLVPKSQGGPSPELTVDAICGPLTKAAILKFQKACGAPCDGRIDPGGPTLKKLLAYDPYPTQDLSAAMACKIGKAGSAAQKAAAEVIIRKIGEAIAKDHGKWIVDPSISPGKLSPSLPGSIPGVATAIADVVHKATQAAAKVVEQAAKQGGLPVGPNPFGPPPAFKLQEVVRKAVEAAQKVAEQTAKQGGKTPGAPVFNPTPQVAGSLAKAASSIADAAIKAAEAVAKSGKVAPAPAPSQSGLGGLASKLAGVIKLAADSTGKSVEQAAKAAVKGASKIFG